MVENRSDDILAGAKDVDVAFLVVGDPFGYALRPGIYFLHSNPLAVLRPIQTSSCERESWTSRRKPSPMPP